MDCFALYFLLLMTLLPLYNGCAGPPVLCCSGQNNSCHRGCFCDEACVALRDCCPDYNSTCTQPFTTALPNGSSTANNNTMSTPVDGSKPTASTVSTTTGGTTLTETSTTPDTSSVTPPPADGGIYTGIVHLKVSVLTHEEENEDVILEAVSSFVAQAQVLLQQICRGCTLKMRRIKLTGGSSV